MSAQDFYVDKDRFFQRLNPVTSIVLVASLSVGGLAFEDPRLLAVPLLAALAVTLYSGGLRNLRRILFLIVALSVFGLVIWSLYTPPTGRTLFELGPLTMTTDRLEFALARTGRIMTFLFSGVAFITITSNEGIVQGLRRLRFPYAFCFTIGTALRLFPTFLDSTATVQQAQEARGQDFSEGNAIQRVKNYVPLIVPVIMTAFQNVDSQSMALKTRGFSPTRERSFYRKASFGGTDYAVMAVCLAFVAVAVYVALLGVPA
jgi:energy-coupling factor transport system permease protein